MTSLTGLSGLNGLVVFDDSALILLSAGEYLLLNDSEYGSY